MMLDIILAAKYSPIPNNDQRRIAWLVTVGLFPPEKSDMIVPQSNSRPKARRRYIFGGWQICMLSGTINKAAMSRAEIRHASAIPAPSRPKVGRGIAWVFLRGE